MSFSAPSTKRSGKPGRRATTGRGRPGDRACARGSILRGRRFRRRSAFWYGAGLDGASRRIGWRCRSGLEGEPAADSEDMPAEIAAELGLAASLTPDQLAARWRNFVWRNHPDRQPAHARQRANARVALANTLYDRARRGLAERR